MNNVKRIEFEDYDLDLGMLSAVDRTLDDRGFTSSIFRRLTLWALPLAVLRCLERMTGFDLLV